MRRVALGTLVGGLTLAVMAGGYALVGRLLAGRDVLEATFSQGSVAVPALVAVLFGLRLFLVLVAPAWAFFVAVRAAAALWQARRRRGASLSNGTDLN